MNDQATHAKDTTSTPVQTPAVPAAPAAKTKASMPKRVNQPLAAKQGTQTPSKATAKTSMGAPTKVAAKGVAQTAKPLAKKAQPSPSPAKPAAKIAPKVSVLASTSAPSKEKKTKVVRDSFTFPKAEYEQLARVKERALALGISVKKGELLRCGMALLASTSDKALAAAIANLPKIKAGRPKH